MGRDLRRYARSTHLRLILGGLVIVLLVGGGLIWWLYGPRAAGMALLCVGAALAPALLILVALLALEWISRSAGGE
jgi:NhaP-type Na+/H+ or K+/H+ antiporter